jgi:hypothetical protein
MYISMSMVAVMAISDDGIEERDVAFGFKASWSKKIQ